jgi:hypothetical protein
VIDRCNALSALAFPKSKIDATLEPAFGEFKPQNVMSA